MSQSYIVQVTVTKIEIIDDGNPHGGLELWGQLFCEPLGIHYAVYDYRKTFNTGDVIKAPPFLFRSLFTQVVVTDQKVVRFRWHIANGQKPAKPGEGGILGEYQSTHLGVEVPLDIDLSKISPQTNWYIETHAVHAAGGVAKVRISFDMKTMPFDHNTNRFPSVWGCSGVNGSGAAVDLTPASRRVDAYPMGSDSSQRFQKMVWRTDFNQMAPVGNDHIRSLVGTCRAHAVCVVILYEHAFGAPNFDSGRREEIVLGQKVLNLTPNGLFIRWPPAPNLDNKVSAVEVALFRPPVIN